MIKPPNNYAHLFPSGCGNIFKNNVFSNLGPGGKCVDLTKVTDCSFDQFSKDINNIIL